LVLKQNEVKFDAFYKDLIKNCLLSGEKDEILTFHPQNTTSGILTNNANLHNKTREILTFHPQNTTSGILTNNVNLHNKTRSIA
jgi:hypothetical protein